MKSPVFLDTQCFIYLVEQNSDFLLPMKLLFDDISKNKIVGVTSILTLSEILVKPFKDRNTKLVNAYLELVNELPNFKLLSPNNLIAINAAKIRAEYNILLPDAYQLAMAQEFGCRSFLTNDNQLKRYKQIEVITLNEIKQR